MKRRDNNIPYTSTEGKTFLQGQLSSFDKATEQAFWSFHDFLEQNNVASSNEVRTKDLKRNGTTVYHANKAIVWVNIRTDNPKWIEVILYTGLDNQNQFPGTRPCWFRQNRCGGDKFNLTRETLAIAQRYAVQSSMILDQER